MKFNDEKGDGDDQFDGGGHKGEPSEAECIPNLEIPKVSRAQNLLRSNSVFEDDAPLPLDLTSAASDANPQIADSAEEANVSTADEANGPMSHVRTAEAVTTTPVSSIAGVAKILSRPEEMSKTTSIEESDNPRAPLSSNIHIQRMRSTNKMHVKHRFEDKDEDDYTSCKFICHTFWATQFHALRALFLDDDSDEGNRFQLVLY